MTKGAGLLIEGQLIAARSRNIGGHFEGSLRDALFRLEDLRKAIQVIDPVKNSELFRYFPVAAIAVLETHFKSIVQIIVDAGSPYLERGLSLAKDRSRSISDLFPSLHQKVVTVGELVAHQLPFNSVGSIEEPLGVLLDGKFKTILGTVCDPFSVRGELECSPIVDDVDALWRDLAETFERRHILAHEAATNYSVTLEQAICAVDCVTFFVMVTEALLWQSVWKSKPLTQVDFRDEAAGQLQAARLQLAKALRQGRRHAKRAGRLRGFHQLHWSWKEYAEQWMQWEIEDYGMGAMKLLVRYQSLARLYAAREQDVVVWCSSFVDLS